MKFSALLTDLPGIINCYGDVGEEFANGLKLISSEQELEDFTTKWKSLWELPYRKDMDLSEVEESIVNNTYDKTVALDCIRKGRTGICEHAVNNKNCAGMIILMPPILTICFLLSQKYGVPFNVALIQLQKSLDNLPDYVANQVF